MTKGNPDSSRKLIIGVILSLAGFSISANTLPPLVTGLARSYAVNPSLFGIAFFFQYASFTVFSFLSGYISGRGHTKPELILVSALAVAGVILPFINIIPTFPAFILFMVIIGGCGGLVESNGTSILTRYDTSVQGKYVYVSQLFYCLGAMIAPLVIGILQAGHFSDGLIGFAVGILTLIFALTVYQLISSAMKIRTSYTTTAASENTLFGTSMEKAPPLKTFFWFLLVMLLYVMIEISVGSWLPTYLEYNGLMMPSSASLHLTLFWAGLAATRFLYIFISTGSIRMQLTLHITGILACTSFLFFTSESPVAQAVAIFLLGGFCGPVWPLIVNLYSKRYTSKHYVMYLVGAGSLGALLGIIFTSVMLEYKGIGSLMVVLGVYGCLLVSACTVLILKIRRVTIYP